MQSLSLPCEKGLFVILFTLGAHPAPGGFLSKRVPVSSVRYPVSPPPHGTRCTGSRCYCSAFGSSQRMLTPLFVRHIAQIFSHCSLYILSTPYLYITTNYILCFRLGQYNILCLPAFVFTASAAPSPEAPARPCTCPRSAALSALAFRCSLLRSARLVRSIRI